MCLKLGSSEADAKMELGARCLLGINTKRKEKEEELGKGRHPKNSS